jgi:hypothetical protein
VVAEHGVFGCWQESGRTNRAGHESRSILGAVAISNHPGQLGGLVIQLVGQLADPVLLELGQAAAKRVGLDDIGADLEE